MLQALAGIPTQLVARQDKGATGNVWSVFLVPGQIVKAARKLIEAEYSLEDILALDFNEGFLVLYHFNRWTIDERVTLRVLIPRDNPVVPSIASVYDGAEWHERETRDFHGIIFEGNPNLVPLLMPVESADLHPLVKSDKARLSIKDVLSLGEVVSSTGVIDALFAVAEAGEASDA
ncbi:MAG: NADH-quinone oxidoreductase subunit C [Pseudodesulfovibrio sp.]|uniref:NADH dehydrogenase (Ubiquinone) 30 kDa subunit n=1 Tax=Pseudodesulfovibrio aespoeensis (strain ATCC 700646 / DSM 10631 / Aspo-2) TaxID=643562 RepID=E6VUR3_PSEA9|nr:MULTISPECIES: NADH-quinone oxidoreductase subunit C [Pseudodesulfovibrio]MBU4379860.1 NADH-quinone oxidoreductase subunit C [Pseudomonadota bacterium]ADU62304.1 NADH dehydrogenase (ubiquinone) 30 kDa subunit [Pseudodesulfovibrio aespoeensis Aspo-2]MBU4474031.1 NADH-quinone oxidoreductase subunit C [Pseudomonadota bacterium]MBU4515229.1 NADH-quinone oxidoreductase subunit C [Pseudomonadota bacterium]MBU4521134.1 NADH-quinone oxidoreductase subunit C [Pseudomonadota bacterium]